VRAAVPWFLVAASVLFASLTLYVLFAGFLPARERGARLEGELRALYTQEAQLHGTLAQVEQRLAQREGEIRLLRAERDALARRVEELTRRSAGPRPR
jgi:membrane protein implicated in regulation of membrane protease activity